MSNCRTHLWVCDVQLLAARPHQQLHEVQRRKCRSAKQRLHHERAPLARISGRQSSKQTRHSAQHSDLELCELALACIALHGETGFKAAGAVQTLKLLNIPSGLPKGVQSGSAGGCAHCSAQRHLNY